MQILTRLTLFGIRLAPILLGVYWILLFTGTHLPSVPMPKVQHLDKVQHFVAFSGLAFLLAWAIPTHGRDPRTKMIFAFLVAVCYGLFDELTQQFVGRHTDMLDFAADCAGALLGVLIYRLAKHILFPPGPKHRQGQAGGPTVAPPSQVDDQRRVA